jgi:mono/diheme cytochrome c family protein
MLRNKKRRTPMRKLFTLVAASVALIFPVLATAQTTVKRVPVKPTSTSGSEMFKEYCAACHGLSGKGDGPAAPALKTMPANLTTLAARNGGQFPEDKVVTIIKEGPNIAAHGSKDMPVWGDVFLAMSLKTTEGEVQLRIHNLTEYIKTLQSK